MVIVKVNLFNWCISTYASIKNPGKFELNWSSKLRDNNESKNTLVTRSCVLSDA